jgi:hypothetical protein
MSTIEGFDLFDVRYGTVQAVFAAPQATVSIDADATLPPEYFGTPTNRPFFEIYDTANNLLDTKFYSGNLVTGGFETLSFDAGSALIRHGAVLVAAHERAGRLRVV